MNIGKEQFLNMEISNDNMIKDLGINNFGAFKTRENKSFGEILGSMLESANTYQKQYESLVTQQISGDDVDVHDVAIAGEKAKISLELVLQIRNKALDAYQEIMRMQV